MDLNRREFLSAAAVGISTRAPQPYFGLNAFIEENPKAVFIRRTKVQSKTDANRKREEGLRLAREIFVPLDRPGIPVSHRVVLKPNATPIRGQGRPDIENWGTGTDPQFYEGLVMGLKEIGLKKFTFVEANHFANWNLRGWVDINEKHGIEMNEPEAFFNHPRHERTKLFLSQILH